MNHVYRLAWSSVHNMLVVVAEIAGSRSKGGTPRATGSRPAMSRILQGLALLLAPTVALALPTGGQVVAGQATLNQAGNTLTIDQSSSRAILNWQSFGIGSGETVNFNQPGTSSIALNRVLGNNASDIFGHLNANGQVFLVNPNGVFFAPGAQVNTGGILASTLNISNADFLNGNYHFSGASTATVANEGSITAGQGGYVAFIGNHVRNDGNISTPGGTTALGAGGSVDMALAGTQLLSFQVSSSALGAQAANGGVIQANGGVVILSAQARNALLQTTVNNTGVIEAQTAENHNGTIELLGGDSGTVQVAGTLDASAPTGGSGGKIETSGEHVKIADTAKITTKSQSGEDGDWLIDPVDFTIAASGGDISGATLSANLNSGNVEIQSTTGATSGNGDINVNDTVSWSANTLTLNAQRDININSAMNGSGTAGLALEYGQGSTNGVIGGITSSDMVNAPVNLATTSSFSTKLGSSGATVNYTIINSLGAQGSTTGTDLQGINGDLAGNYVLGSDIDASATATWNPDGVGGYYGFKSLGSDIVLAGATTITGSFTGSFDGLGHTITKLTASPSGFTSNSFIYGSVAGLFGVIGGAAGTNNGALNAVSATVRNVGLIDGNVAGITAGGLVGVEFFSTISNSYATGTVSGDNVVGGLVGGSVAGTITDSYATNTVTVSGTNANGAGGLVGINIAGGIIRNAYATGSVVDATGSNVGGLVGGNRGIISDSYATGNVSARSGVGGLVGYNGSSNGPDGVISGTISNSHATGSVSGSNTVGGLVGFNASNAVISNAYATGNVSGTDVYVGGLVGLNSNATITNAYATGSVSAVFQVGGLVGLSVNDTISNAYATGSVSGSGNVGGLVGSNVGGTISNGYATGSVNGTGSNVGGLVGSNSSNAIISNAYATGSVSGSGYNVGGLVGFNSNATISNAYATGNVSGSDYVGGLVGSNYYGTIGNAYSTGNVTGSGDYVGGLVGSNYYGTISNAYATGNVSGSGDYVGGLVGSNYNSTISNAYATGNVSGSGDYVGGLIGNNSNGTLSNGYWDTTTGLATGIGGSNAGTVTGGGGLSTASLASALPSGFSSSDWANAGNQTTPYLLPNSSFDTVSGHVILGTDSGATPTYYDVILTLTQLQNINTTGLAGNYVLGTSIDASATSGWNGGAGFAPIGPSINNAFRGVFDGLGYSVDNLSINRTGTFGVGLFGFNLGTLENVGVVGGNVSGGAAVGGLVGGNASGTISNAYATGSVSGGTNVGGLVGYNSNATISNAYAAGSVSGSSHVGGLVGSNAEGTISNTYATGNVSGTDTVGGLVGFNISGPISNAYASGGVTGGSRVGGLIGYNDAGSISDAYATGNVSSADTVGGLVGLNSNGGVISNAYATGSVSSSSNVGGGLVGYNSGTISNAYATGGVSGNNIVGGLVGYNYSGPISDAHATGNVSGTNTVGGLVGLNSNGPISNAYATGSISGSNYVGGLVGYNFSSLISTAYATGSVSGSDTVGGLVGLNSNGAISNAYATGSVSGSSNYVGGLVGDNDSSSISNAYATGNVSGTNVVGGLVGYNTGTISNAYAAGNVSGTNAVGGLVGTDNGGSVSNGYWDTTTAPGVAGIGGGTNTGATGLTDAQMMQQANFIGFDFTNVWVIYEGHTYPLLRSFLKPLTITSDDQTHTYDGNTFTLVNPVYSIPGADTSGHLFGLDSPYDGAKDVGTYQRPDLWSDQQGYLIQASGSLTITPLTVMLSGSRSYDGTADIAGSFLTASNLVSGDMLTIGGSGTLASKNVGSEAITVTGLTLSNSNYTLAGASGSVDITPASLTLANLAADNKTYDGNTSATATADLSGVIMGDAVSNSLSASFADKNAGSGKTVTVDGVTLSGTDAGNYIIASGETTTADISQATLTLSNLAADNKIYDGNTSATATADLSGVIMGDTVSSSLTASFADKNVGTGKTVTVDGVTLSGADAGNYTIVSASGETTIADITAATLTLANLAADNKIYDGNTSATATADLSGVIVGDTVGNSLIASFDNKNAGTGKTVTIDGVTLSGADADNYIIATGETTTADISQAMLTLSNLAADNKIYDGNTSATATADLGGVIMGDVVSNSLSASFADKNVGTGKTVTVDGVSLSGADAGNYVVANGETTTADISQAMLTLSNLAADNKIYDGNTSATATADLSGVIVGDVVSNSLSASFADKNVGTGKTVTVDGVTLNGADAGNYTIVSAGGETTTADITPAALTLSNLAADNKIYDGNTSATATADLSGVIMGDTVSSSLTASFADKNVGTGKTVTVGGVTLSGADAGNYTIASASGETTTADITPAALTLSNLAADNKIYDGSTSATATADLSGVIVGDTVGNSLSASFDNKNAGTHKTVTVDGVTLSGADAGNYVIANGETTTADITPATLTLTNLVADNKIYDATTAADVTGTLRGVIAGDTVSNSLTASFDNKNAGTDKTVTVDGISLSGADAGNYVIADGETTTADITPASLTLAATSATKTYDGTTASSGTVMVSGLQGSDRVTSLTESYDSKNVQGSDGSTLSVDDGYIVDDGNGGGNYTVATQTATGTIDPLALSLDGLQVADKPSDGSTSATILSDGTLVGVIDGDSVDLDGSNASAAFADPQIGSNKPVSVIGLTLTGSDAGNYLLSSPQITTASIFRSDGNAVGPANRFEQYGVIAPASGPSYLTDPETIYQFMGGPGKPSSVHLTVLDGGVNAPGSECSSSSEIDPFKSTGASLCSGRSSSAPDTSPKDKI